MREVIVVGYQNYNFAKSLVVGEIIYEDFCLDLKEFDSLIFTSKNAILSLEYNAKKHPQMQGWKQKPSYVIGKGSAKVLKELGGNLASISPNSHGKEFASFLQQTLKPKERLLYLRAKNIVSNLDEILKQSGFSIHSQIAYCSQILHSTQKPPKDSVLLFTSPSAYDYFLQNFQWDESYLAIAIGKSTFERFESGISKEISPIQEIEQSTKLLQSRFSV